MERRVVGATVVLVVSLAALAASPWRGRWSAPYSPAAR